MIDENVGGTDLVARGVLAAALGVLGVAVGTDFLPGGPVVGAALLAAATGLGFNVATRRCLLNHLLGIDTCPAPDADPEA